MNNSRIKPIARAALLAAMLFASGAQAVDIAPRVAAQASQNGSADALIVFDDGALPAIDPSLDYRARRRAVVDALRARAESHQRNMREWLDSQGVAHDDFWIVDAIHARLTPSHLQALASRSEAMHIEQNPTVTRSFPFASPLQTEAPTIGWGVTKINAPSVWAAGFTGQGVVIGGEDTGYQWDHPILKPQYRGWNGTTADHNYNWHDAIHDARAGNPCGSNSPAPCDDDEHGTHTAGTFAGDDGSSASPRHQYGVAPGAKWIGCRNMDEGDGTPARYIECMQFMLAPTDSQRSERQSRSRRRRGQQLMELSGQRRLRSRHVATRRRCAGRCRRFLRGGRAEFRAVVLDHHRSTRAVRFGVRRRRDEHVRPARELFVTRPRRRRRRRFAPTSSRLA